ncbi:SapC protein [Roseibium hamelinense]|uniref:SapC protein n=1 Tax=Roseibium hamelinense TaxID=150831 RepID=A0A562T2K5_9HYPH|nr:SapC family protein [Roseibium hamelinense]MTI44447.1 peptidase [Roseibium hamelinense]TWI87414.1 SapC protein [Roseibium hamelinense]
MVAIQPISRERHAPKRWARFQNYNFAREEAIAPIVAAEFPKAVHAFPVGFLKDGDAFYPVAVLGIERGKNLYVGPDGKWIGGYTPAILRGYPFRIGQTEDGNQLLCIDEDSGLVTDGPEGEPFFAEDGSLSPEISKILDFLGQTHQNRQATLKVCALLAQKKLITEWPITVRTADGDQTLDGLYRVDEAALNALPADAFEEVRQAGALPLIYAQLLSMQHMALLGRLAEAHAQRAALMSRETPQVPDLTKSLTNSDTIDWSKFGIEG